jgi:hypothetical protein
MDKQQWISSKIAKLIGEGRSQQQAIAMAYSMWEQGDNKQEGGYHDLPMAQEAIMKRPKRLDGSNNMYANGNSYNGFGQTINPMQGMGNTPFKSQAYGIPMGTPFDSTQKGFYPTQGNTSPSSVSYGQGVPVVPNTNPNISPFAKANIDQIWTKPTLPNKKSNKVAQVAAPTVQKAPVPAARTPLVPLTDITVGMTIKTPAEQLQESAKKGLEPLGSQYNSGTDAETKPEMDWIKYNILNPYGQGMDLGTSLAYTGQQFGKGNIGMGITGAGLSALKGVRSFLSGYGSGKGERNVEQEMKDKLYNSDEQLYRGNRGVFKEGGEITNADLLTGNYITEEGQQNPNIEIEGGEHTKNSQTGEVQEAAGKKHSEGGISVNLPDQSKVLSDYTKIGSTNVKAFEGMFDVKLKASDTFATVLDKYNKKIGINKLEEEEKELITKVEKNSNSSIEKKTKQVNEDFLAQELAELSKKKEALNKVKSEAFEVIFKEQEKIPKKGDGTQVLDESGKPMAQEGGVMDENIIALAEQYGTTPEQILQILQENNMKQEGGEQQAQGQPDPQQIIQAYAQMAGQDPNQVIQQLQQMPPEEQQAALQQMVAALQQGQQSGQEQQQALQEGGEGGGGVSQEQVVQALRQGADPNQVIEQLIQSGVSHEEAMSIVGSVVQQMQQQPQGMTQEQQPMMQKGGTSYDPNYSYGKQWTKADKKLRYESALQQARLLGYNGNLTKNDFEKDNAWGELQKYVTEKRPSEVEQYAKDTRLTAKHIRDIKAADPSIFKSLGISMDKPNEGYSEEEAQLISDAAKNSTKIPKTFWTEGFNDNLGAYRFPMVGTNVPAQGMVKGAQAQVTAPNMSRYFSTPEEAVAEDTPAGVVETEKPKSKNPVRGIISTEGLPYVMPPSAPLAPYLQQVSLSRLEGQKGSAENQLAASENARQAAYQSTKGLPPAQAAAMMANYLATSGQQDTAGIAQQEQQDLGNKARIEQYNAGQSDKEQILNEQLKKQYEREAFGTLNVNEQSWRNYYDANQANQQAASDKIDRRNIMNLGLTNYQLNGSGGIEFVNTSPFYNNTSSYTLEQQKIIDEALKKSQAYKNSASKKA